MRAFDDLVTQGKVRYVGCSNNSAWQVMKALAVSDRLGLTRYICQQVNYNLIARDVEHEIIPLGARSVGRADGVEPAACRAALSGKFRRDAPRPSVSRLNELDVPGTVDFERVYRIVDKLTEIATAREVYAGAGRAQLGDEQAGRGHRDHRRARRSAAPRQSRGSRWRLSAEEMAALDEVSALPEPYPMWHQHKFGIERNPRLPSMRD